MKYPKVIERLAMILTEVGNLEFLYDIGDICEESTKEELLYLNNRLDFFEAKIKGLENEIKWFYRNGC